MSDCAFLNNSGNFTSFTYAGRTIRFRTPSSLERYTDILEWDKGYLVVTAKYKGAPAEEEYIDPVSYTHLLLGGFLQHPLHHACRHILQQVGGIVQTHLFNSAHKLHI